MSPLPTGTVTFVFTDVVGSTRVWEAEPDAMHSAMEVHDALIEGAVDRHHGVVVRPRGEGDSRFAVFPRARDAAAAALAITRAIEAEPWPTTQPLRLRMALHTGEADVRAGDYYGSAVNRCARLRSVARPGQILCSHTTADLVEDHVPRGAMLLALGPHRLKDLARPEQIYELVADDPTRPTPVVALTGTARAVLEIGPPGSVETAVLDAERVTVGRSSANDVVLADPTVSQFHAVLERYRGYWCIKDVGSSNGTLVDGKPVSGDHRLRSGTEILFGDAEVVFRIDSQTEDDKSTVRRSRG